MSYEIDHQIGVKASPKEIYDALTDTKKLARWWTSDTRGSGARVGDTLEFWFGEFCQKFDVKALTPGKLVCWKAPKGGGMDEWDGTEIAFALTEGEDQTYVRFTHGSWRKNTEMFSHCSMKWATFMLSLKDLLEKGKGHPAPEDIEINHD